MGFVLLLNYLVNLLIIMAEACLLHSLPHEVLSIIAWHVLQSDYQKLEWVVKCAKESHRDALFYDHSGIARGTFWHTKPMRAHKFHKRAKQYLQSLKTRCYNISVRTLPLLVQSCFRHTSHWPRIGRRPWCSHDDRLDECHTLFYWMWTFQPPEGEE